MGFELGDLALQHARFFGLATQVLCRDVLTSGVQGPALGRRHGGNQNRLGLMGNNCGAGLCVALRRRCLIFG